MRDPPARHDGRWLMTPLDLRRRRCPPPRERTGPQRLFLPPSWYRVVSHGISGLQDEILSTITTCHATASRTSVLLSLYLSASPLQSLLRFRLALSFFLLLSFPRSLIHSFFPSLLSLSLSRSLECSHLFQTTMFDGRLRLIRQRRTRGADRCNQGDRFMKV